MSIGSDSVERKEKHLSPYANVTEQQPSTDTGAYHAIESLQTCQDLANSRTVYFNQDILLNSPFEYCSNIVITSKYTKFTFLPKFLFHSFKKLANAYFLLVSCLQTVKNISNTHGLPSNAPVLVFILAVDAVLEIIEDRRRHKADEEANSAVCYVIDPHEASKSGPGPKDETYSAIPVEDSCVKSTRWAELRVGSIIKLHNRETAPADLLILAVNESDPNNIGGICYVETKSLDGETNLKLRQAMPSTMNLHEYQDIASLRGKVNCELPNKVITKFDATLEVTDRHSGTKKCTPVSITNVILRGCQLRSTEWIYGLVLNTGKDTKIMQSMIAAPSKWSSINDLVNRMIIWLFFFLTLCGIVATTYQVIWNESNIAGAYYLLWSPVAAEQWFLGFGYYFLLMYQVIPVALYVTVSIVMFAQALFMEYDVDLYHEESDTRAIVRTMALNEELGQISYVFSDKTGTLTRNIMEFRKCSINGVSYGTGGAEVGGRKASLPVSESAGNEGRTEKDLPFRPDPYVNFEDPTLFEDMNGGVEKNMTQAMKIHDFFMHLALCQTVIPEKVKGQDKVNFSASSPDEQALVSAARVFGFEFISRDISSARVKVKGEILEYQILCILEFTSARKRMSVIVRNPKGGIEVLVKGADNVIYERLANLNDLSITATDDHVIQYADEGLRTLVIAKKELSENDFITWATKYEAATNNLAEMQKKKNGLENSIDDLMDEIETGLTLLGATAIEDKLQEGVPNTIQILKEAGMKVWMLTGDKQETAINIAYACHLINNDMTQVILNTHDLPTHSDLEHYMQEIIQQAMNEEKEKDENDDENDDDDDNYNTGLCNRSAYALIVTGESLEMALKPDLVHLFVRLAQACKAVVCCRVSPSQKAEVVCAIKLHVPRSRTLAIGDGANDVAMIQNAHVGVGISGQEGMQAVNVSDYAISQFRFLEKLLLHHGRLNYARMARLVGYMFYKNILMVIVQYYFTFFGGTSGQKYYNELGFQLYNLAYTSIPICYLGVFDVDVPFHISRRYPRMYLPGIRMELFSMPIFLRWLFDSIFESAIILVISTYGYNSATSAIGSSGRVEYGLIAFTLVILVANIKVFLIQWSWSLLAVGLWLFGIISWIPTTIVVSSYWVEVFYTDTGIFENVLDNSIFWLIVPVTISAALGVHFAFMAFQRAFYPTYSQIIQEKHVLRTIQKVPTDPAEKHSTSRTNLKDIKLAIIQRDGTEALPDNESFSQQKKHPLDEVNEPYEDDKIRRSRYVSAPSLLFSRRNHGFAFSYDPQSTHTESFIATHKFVLKQLPPGDPSQVPDSVSSRESRSATY